MRTGLVLLLLAAAGCSGWDGVLLEVPAGDRPAGRWQIDDPEAINQVELWLRFNLLTYVEPEQARLIFFTWSHDPNEAAAADGYTFSNHESIRLGGSLDRESLDHLRSLFEKHGRPVDLNRRLYGTPDLRPR